MACQDYATALAASLKDLTNHGAQLVHAGIPVENILVLNAGEFDVRDLLPGALQLVDSVSGQRILVLSTYANKERMRVLGDDVCRGVGAAVPWDTDALEEEMKVGKPDSIKGCVPHWWLARSTKHLVVECDHPKVAFLMEANLQIRHRYGLMTKDGKNCWSLSRIFRKEWMSRMPCISCNDMLLHRQCQLPSSWKLLI